MDSVTHIFLGGAIAPALYGKKLGRVGWIVGALAATLPDADVFLRTGDSILDHALHRSCTHALVMVPVIGVLAALPFAALRRFNPLWKQLMIVAMLAALSHVLLDACTSYGTQLFWPFSTQRFSWDLIAIIDPVFTLPLLFGLWLSNRRGTARPARVGLALAAAYMALAFVQHERALSVQQAILVHRGQTSTQARVLPVIGTINGYRSIYQSDRYMFADAIRVPFFAGGQLREGERMKCLEPDAALDVTAQQALRTFTEFADGYVATLPDRPEVIADMRYSAASDAFRPYWGVRLTPRPDWVSLSGESRRSVRAIWREMIGTGEWKPVREWRTVAAQEIPPTQSP